MRPIPIILFLAAWSTGPVHGQPPPGYYDPAQGLQGEALRQALRNIIDDHSATTYPQLWNHFQSTDRKSDGSVWDMYTDVPNGTPQYVFQFVTDQCGGYTAEGDCYNREHSFPQSWFGEQPPMVTDLFHIYPTDGHVNGIRGNLAYGEVGNANTTTSNGSKRGSNTYPGYSGQVFEPIDAYKGDFARSYFYMYTRYWGQTGSWSSPMQTGADLSPWARNMFIQWHTDDPVSAKEIARNNAVHTIQGNRNPYIDQPQWAQSIWGAPTGVEVLRDIEVRVWTDGGRVNILLGSAGSAQARVLDTGGRVLSSFVLRQGEVQHPNELPAGLYLLEISTTEHRSVQRFVNGYRP